MVFFAFYEIPDAKTGALKPAGLVLWALFGTTNQLLAGLTLMVASLYLFQRGRNPWFTAVPMVFMLISTFLALYKNLIGFWNEERTLLFVVGLALFLTAVGIIVEGVRAFVRHDRFTSNAIEFADES